ncbi:50S ribosomal protein L19e, partial [Candidatus Bathyarchaeota archaeon]|nr:50S ribosomal protein L19e [Candidatus Bathyarchaeota archaeon]
KGAMKARFGPGNSWPTRIRSQRRLLRELKERRLITTSSYRRLYLMAKGGAFKSLAELRHYIEVQGLARRRLR